MPTARELLEQADALMRRNREAAERVTRESAPPAPQGVAPARGLTPPPPPVVEIPKHQGPPLAAKGNDIAMEEFPVLRQAIGSPPAARTDDDVPVLTDAVQEIDVAAPDVDEGEPSDWLAPPSEDESVLGPSPPSVAVVPPATLPATPKPHREAPPHAGPDFEELTQRVYADSDPDVTVRRVPPLGAPPPVPRVPEIEDLAEAGLADLDPDVTWTRPISPTVVAAPRDEVAAAAPTLAATAPAVPTGADFEALAEEIRMQVLQRIDMFTDTGLRERLGERLKPIVDRASADLVATINQHVGELLRSYVAEAIEREIENWRRGI